MKRSDFQVVVTPLVEAGLPTQIPAACTRVVVLDSLPLFTANKAIVCRQRSDGRPMRAVLVAMEEDRKQFLTAVRQGASGYILQDASAMDVVSGIRAVAQGEAFCPPRMAKFLFDYVAGYGDKTRHSGTRIESSLTRREQELVPLLGQGLTNKEIATTLNISEETVKSHIHRILRKVGVENRHSAFEACQTIGLD